MASNYHAPRGLGRGLRGWPACSLRGFGQAPHKPRDGRRPYGLGPSWRLLCRSALPEPAVAVAVAVVVVVEYVEATVDQAPSYFEQAIFGGTAGREG